MPSSAHRAHIALLCAPAPCHSRMLPALASRDRRPRHRTWTPRRRCRSMLGGARRRPPVQGIFIPRDELSADGSRRVAGNLALVGRAYRNSLETIGSDFSSRSGGASLGLRYIWNAGTLEVRGNYRESQVTRRNLRRTISVVFATPVGPLALSGSADVGEQDNGKRVARLAFYRSDLRWVKDGNTVSFGITHSEGAGPPIQRVDLLTSVKYTK